MRSDAPTLCAPSAADYKRLADEDAEMKKRTDELITIALADEEAEAKYEQLDCKPLVADAPAPKRQRTELDTLGPDRSIQDEMVNSALKGKDMNDMNSDLESLSTSSSSDVTEPPASASSWLCVVVVALVLAVGAW